MMKPVHAVALTLTLALVLFTGQQVRASSSGSSAEYYLNEGQSCAQMAYNQTRNTNAYSAYFYAYYAYQYALLGVKYNNNVAYFSAAYSKCELAISYAKSAYAQTKNSNASIALQYLEIALVDLEYALQGK
jgi:hypothetical protein